MSSENIKKYIVRVYQEESILTDIDDEMNEEYMLDYAKNLHKYESTCVGCGKTRLLDYEYIRIYMAKHGREPLCQSCAAENFNKMNMHSKSEISFGLCTLIRTQHTCRCKLMDKCDFYMRCLDIACDQMWSGWTSKEYGSFE